MANFNYKDYMKNNPLLNEAQGYNDELDDSLGMKHGKKKLTMKQRRADSENMEKAKGKRKYSGDKSKDKVKESYDKVDEEMDKDMKKEIIYNRYLSKNMISHKCKKDLNLFYLYLIQTYYKTEDIIYHNKVDKEYLNYHIDVYEKLIR